MPAACRPCFQDPAWSWWGCYLHSSVPSVASVYTTLQWQSARFCCRSPASSSSTLHVSWARTNPCTESLFQEPTRSCFLLSFYVKLSQSSTRVWLVILTSGRSPVGTGRDAVGFQRKPSERCSPRIYSKQTLCKLLSQLHLRLKIRLSQGFEPIHNLIW